MLNFDFDLEKTVQAAALLLREHHKRMEYIRLLKLLYIADREMLARRGRTLTGDRAVAMKRGPVLSTVYDLIKGNGSGEMVTLWNAAIRRDGYDVVLDGEIGTERLTKTEEAILREVSSRYHETDSDELSDLTHGFAEWAHAFDEKNPTSSFPIDWKESLIAQGKGEWVGEAEALLNERRKAEAAFRE
jgi:uncharacterized phage-associated protein